MHGVVVSVLGVTGLLVPSKSSAQLIQAMKQVIKEPTLRRRLIENGLRDVRERFSWDVVLPRYRELLRI